MKSVEGYVPLSARQQASSPQRTSLGRSEGMPGGVPLPVLTSFRVYCYHWAQYRLISQGAYRQACLSPWTVAVHFTSACATLLARLGGLQSNLMHRIPASEKAFAILGRCPELLSPPAPCPSRIPQLAFDLGASTFAVCTSELAGREYPNVAMVSYMTGPKKARACTKAAGTVAKILRRNSEDSTAFWCCEARPLCSEVVMRIRARSRWSHLSDARKNLASIF